MVFVVVEVFLRLVEFCYENEEDGFWDMVTEETAWEEDDPEPTENLPPVAIASSSGLAYPGDLVELDGTASYDPEGAELSYSWTRLDGPPVAIENATEGTSMFTPEQSGVYTFALVVGDGTLESEAATVDVVVAANSSDDPNSEGNCGGCSTGTGKANPWWMGLLVLFAGRRRA